MRTSPYMRLKPLWRRGEAVRSSVTRMQAPSAAKTSSWAGHTSFAVKRQKSAPWLSLTEAPAEPFRGSLVF